LRQIDFSTPIALVDRKVGMLRGPHLEDSVVGPGAEMTRELAGSPGRGAAR